MSSHYQVPYWLTKQTAEETQLFVIVVCANLITFDKLISVEQCIEQNNLAIHCKIMHSNKVAEYKVQTTNQHAWVLFKNLLAISQNYEFDLVLLPELNRKKELLVCDMDSTIVKGETLDDIAAYAGFGKRVSEITDRAMRGELDFRQALNERVSLLKGIDKIVLDDIADKTQFNAGAECLLKAAKENQIRTVLVSGGFEPIVKMVADKLGFNRYVCNNMEIIHNQLSGKILEPIVDHETKLNVLLEESEQLSIKPEQTCSIGDGANDISMLQASGLGISFHGKPLVRAATPYQINATNLESVISIMNIGINQ